MWPNQFMGVGLGLGLEMVVPIQTNSGKCGSQTTANSQYSHSETKQSKLDNAKLVFRTVERVLT